MVELVACHQIERSRATVPSDIQRLVLVFRARNNNETPHASQRRSWNVSRDMRGTPHGGDAPVRTAAACTQAACTQAVQAVGSAMVLFVEAGLLGLRFFLQNATRAA